MDCGDRLAVRQTAVPVMRNVEGRISAEDGCGFLRDVVKRQAAIREAFSQLLNPIHECAPIEPDISGRLSQKERIATLAVIATN